MRIRVHLVEHRIVTQDGFIYRLSKQFFDLYVLLALRRSTDEAAGGYVEADDILMLPDWVRNDLLSVGKQISRHIGQMQQRRRNIIEAQQRVKGPYRLSVPPKAIQLNETPEAVAAYLGLHIPSPADEGDEERLFRFVDEIAAGELAFNRGALDEALARYETALGAAATPEQRVAGSVKMARVLERKGDYDRAAQILSRTLKDLHTAGDRDYVGKASVLMTLAWLHYRHGDLDRAETISTQGLDLLRAKRHYFLLGYAYNALANIKREREQYHESERFCQKALDYWALTDHLYGIQAAYYNLGALSRIQGDQDLLDQYDRHGRMILTPAVRQKFLRARTLIERAAHLCATARIGSDSAKDQIQLAKVAARLGDADQALALLEGAEAHARGAGNDPEVEMAQYFHGTVKRHAASRDLGYLIAAERHQPYQRTQAWQALHAAKKPTAS